MNIKSLLLGSAAALVAVSGARAADAVVAPEPEPVEYVRVCDTYGTGFYYVPGTEVCLKVGGYVRYDIGVGDLFGDNVDADDDADTYHKRGRFALRMEARTETELGTLQGKVQVNFDWSTANGAADIHPVGNSESIERAWVKLGGFLIGVEDSFFDTFTGYASGVVNDGLIPYGPFTTHTIQYTYDFGNGFSLGAAVEEGNNGDSEFSKFTVGGETIGQGAINDYTPHILVGAAYKGGLFGVSAVGAYDSVQEEFAIKGRVDITPNDMFSFFVMGAWTDDDGDGNFPNGAPYKDNGGNFYATWGGDWAIWAGGAIHFNDRATLNAEFGYNEFSDYSIDVDLNYTVVPGFVVTPGVGFKHIDDDHIGVAESEDNWGAYLRTQFTF
ncbi:porin [Mesorhizobium sp. BAC0120]|uniref:porin n=1 Tax=Mesorhizobium sp. BAC0120 TaxID=3090670 RepID=UPI00298CC9F7|nr:porin [Mesorhizobium sp. BAC0120]MDW6021188.1 porin [Mesorhizobium sp. BAC0120]